MNGWARPDELLRDAPTYAPGAAELADLELLLSGAYAPLTGFLGATDVAALGRTGRLADGSSWPVAVTLDVPEALAAGLDPADPEHRTLILTDPEGAPVATLEVTEAAATSDGMVGLGGPVHPFGDGGHGVFRRLRHTPNRCAPRCRRDGWSGWSRTGRCTARSSPRSRTRPVPSPRTCWCWCR